MVVSYKWDSWQFVSKMIAVAIVLVESLYQRHTIKKFISPRWCRFNTKSCRTKLETDLMTIFVWKYPYILDVHWSRMKWKYLWKQIIEFFFPFYFIKRGFQVTEWIDGLLLFLIMVEFQIKRWNVIDNEGAMLFNVHIIP